MLSELLREILLEESVSVEDITDAIDNHTRVIMNYNSTRGEGNNTGPRVVEVYAYGLTKAGNPVIRAFQPYGDTTSRVPSWKMFRLDRIDNWNPTNQSFSRPASDYYKGLGDFNPNGDNTMSIVYKVAKFDGNNDNSSDEVFRTNTEKNIERLRQQLDNPINIEDLKNQQAVYNQLMNAQKDSDKDDVYITDTERGMQNLRKQLENPRKIDLSQFDKRKTAPKKEVDAVDDTLDNAKDKINSIMGKQMTFRELNDTLSGNNEEEDVENSDNLYKTDTERGLESLKKQLENPRTIDLSKIPKK